MRYISITLLLLAFVVVGFLVLTDALTIIQLDARAAAINAEAALVLTEAQARLMDAATEAVRRDTREASGDVILTTPALVLLLLACASISGFSGVLVGVQISPRVTKLQQKEHARLNKTEPQRIFVQPHMIGNRGVETAVIIQGGGYEGQR